MLRENAWIITNPECPYQGFINSIKQHFPQHKHYTSIDSMFRELHDSLSQPGAMDNSLFIFFVEHSHLQPVSDFLSQNLNPLHYILTVFYDQDPPSLATCPHLFDGILMPSTDLNLKFFFTKLEGEISNKNRISTLQFEVEGFYEIGKALSSERNTLNLFEMILNSSMNMTSSDAGTLYLVVDRKEKSWSFIQDACYEEKLLQFIISKNMSMEVHLEASTSPITPQSIFGYTVITGKPLRIENAYQIPSHMGYRHNRSYDLRTGYVSKSILTVPMKNHKNHILGVIQLINKKKEKEEIIDYTSKESLNRIIPFDYTDEMIMNSLAGQAAVALENNLLYRDMQALLEDYRCQNRQLLILNHKLLKAHEEERRRIAREIHDGPAQSSASLSLRLEICKKYLQMGKSESLLNELNELSANIHSTVKEIRTIIYDLKPSHLDDGLTAALRNRLDIFGESSGIQVSFEVSGDDSIIEYYMASTIYRIVQEALSNIIKHAGAQKVTVDFHIRHDKICLAICDDGKGFDAAKIRRTKPRMEGGFGLEGIRERIELVKGTLSIKSQPGHGTKIIISIPVSQPISD